MAKAGAKLGGVWAPRRLHILDAAYASSCKLSLEAGVSIGGKLDEIAAMLGLGASAAWS